MAKKRLFEEEEWTLEFDQFNKYWRIVVRHPSGMAERFITCYPYPPATQEDVQLMTASPNLYRELKSSIIHLKSLKSIYQIAGGRDSQQVKDLTAQIEHSEKALAKADGR